MMDMLTHCHILFVGLVSTIALAGAAVSVPDSIEEALSMMDSDLLADREAGERAMANAPGVTLADIEQLAQSLDRSPEQRHRLRQVARRLFDSRLLAGMGVQFQGFSDEGVIIGDTIEGFPARDVLLPLDMIQACNGEPMRTQDDLRWAILSRDPGDVIRLTVKRRSGIVELDVALGSFADLPNAIRPTSVDLAFAFAVRWQRVVGVPQSHTRPLGGDMTVEEWARVEAGQITESTGPLWPMTRESASRMVAFGGRPRSALAARQALADFSEPYIQGGAEGARMTTIAEIVDQMRSLNRQRIVVDQRAQTLERHADMVVDPARQEQLINMRNAALQEIIVLDSQLATLRESLRQIRETGGD